MIVKTNCETNGSSAALLISDLVILEDVLHEPAHGVGAVVVAARVERVVAEHEAPRPLPRPRQLRVQQLQHARACHWSGEVT